MKLYLLSAPLVLATACSFSASGGDNGDNVVIDAAGGGDGQSPADAQLGVPDAMPCNGLTVDPLFFEQCLLDDTDADVNLTVAGTYTLRTNDCVLRKPDETALATGVLVDQAMGEPKLCVLWGNNITLGAGVTVRVRGENAAVVVAYGDLSISGIVDGRGLGELPGPGTSTVLCNALGGTGKDGPEEGDNNNDPANPGGGGGGYGGAGGHGGKIGLPKMTAFEPPGGISNGLTNRVLRGGCNGGRGSVLPNVKGGLPGAGGGALALIASGRITVTGIVSVSGGGGGGALNGGVDWTGYGGGGGGSGGALWMIASNLTIQASGRVTANGGGGGRGGEYTFNDQPDGADGASNTATPAPGGNITVGETEEGGRGGDGAAGAVQAGADGFACTENLRIQTGCGGGGGGGGVGAIYTAVPDIQLMPGSVVSPGSLTAP